MRKNLPKINEASFFKKKIALKTIALFILLFSFQNSFSAYYWQVSSIISHTGGNTYALNAPANPLVLDLQQCSGGISQPHNSTSYNITWYVNAVNSTVGGTQVATSGIFTPWVFTTTQSYTPPTNVAGTYYYYAVLSNPSLTTCGFTTTLTSATQQVIVTPPLDTLNYHAATGVNGGTTASITFNNLSTCQSGVFLDGGAGIWNGSVWSNGNFTVIVNGTNIGSFPTPSTVDLTSYIPVTSVQVTSNAGTWHTVDATVHVTSLPTNTAPTTSNIAYNVGASAVPLTAVLTGTGTTLKWYTSVNGDGYSSTAPTPSTATAGTTSYWVAQADAGGCESVRSEIMVLVGVDTLNYHAAIGVNGGTTASVTFNNFSTCQSVVSLDGGAGIWNGSVWSNGNFNLIVNGTNIGSFSTPSTVDLTSYIPITSVQVTSNAGTWHTVDATVHVLTSSVAAGPTVSNISFCQGTSAVPLTATLTGTGSTLKWYTTVNGDSYSSTAPTPNTSTPGVISYWVAQADAGGCESLRSEIVVTVNGSSVGTDLQTACNTFTWIDGNTYTASNNTATHTLTNATGCDSVVTLNLTIKQPTTGSQTFVECAGFSVTVGTSTYTTTGIFTDVLVGANGCDSTVTTNLTINTVDATVDNTLAPVLSANQSGATYQWVDCDNSNAPISGEMGQIFTASANGNYAVEVTLNSCTVTSACENITGVGIQQNATNVVSIYPNPTSGFVTIDLGNNTSVVNYLITTIEGRVVENGKTSSNLIRIDLGNESKGVYFIQVSKDASTDVYRLIKQ